MEEVNQTLVNEDTGLFSGGPMRELSEGEQVAIDSILPETGGDPFNFKGVKATRRGTPGAFGKCKNKPE